MAFNPDDFKDDGDGIIDIKWGSHGGGSVSEVDTVAPLSGGPITDTGTITTLMNTNKLIGRGTSGTGVMEEITLGTGLSFTGTTLNASGGGSPGGSDTQVQFNDSDSFAGDANLTWDKTNNILTVGNTDQGFISGGDEDLSVITRNDETGSAADILIRPGDTGTDDQLHEAGNLNLVAGNSQDNDLNFTDSFPGNINMLAGSALTLTGPNGKGNVNIVSGVSYGDGPYPAGDVLISAAREGIVGALPWDNAGLVRLSSNVMINRVFKDSTGYPGSSEVLQSGLQGGLIIENGTPPDGTLDGLGFGILYMQSGALKFRGAGGTVTTIANS